MTIYGPPKSAVPKAENRRNHIIVARAWGKASDYSCLLCFDTAAEWAWMWRSHPDPSDPGSYQPLCKLDHYDYDKELRVASGKRTMEKLFSDPEYRAKRAVQSREQMQTPEFKAASAAASRERLRAQWRDPEYKAKMLSVLRANASKRK